jgi:hypothetical protein
MSAYTYDLGGRTYRFLLSDTRLYLRPGPDRGRALALLRREALRGSAAGDNVGIT